MSGDPRMPDYTPPAQSGDVHLPCQDPCCIVCGHGDENVDAWRVNEEEDES